MRRIKTLASALVIALVVLTCIDYAASAATGHAFILGKINKANNVTTLTRTTGGPALKLKTTSSSAVPLKVNGTGKVSHLNADRLDGLDSSVLRTRAYAWTKTVSVQTSFNVIVPIPPGQYVVGYNAYMNGGGTAGGAASCVFLRARALGDILYFARTRVLTDAASPSLSGSGIVTIIAGDVLRLSCDAPDTWSTSSNAPVQIYAIATTPAGGGALP